MVNALASLPSFFLLALASSHFKRDMRLHERRDGIPDGFTSKGPAPGNAALRLRIALVQNNIEGTQTKLMDVSGKSNPHYGQWLSKKEVGTFVTPKPETVIAVKEWSSANGIKGTVFSPFGDWICFDTTVSRASKLFDAEFPHLCTTEAVRVPFVPYSIPASLIDHLELVHPTIFPSPNDIGPRIFSPPAKAVPSGDLISADKILSTCNLMDPSCLQQLYGIPKEVSVRASSNTLPLFKQVAFQEFLRIFRPDAPPLRFKQSMAAKTYRIASKLDLDVQYTIGLASGMPTVFISVAIGDQYQDGDLEGFLDIINFLNGKSAPPQVLTTSYGQDETPFHARWPSIIRRALLKSRVSLTLLFSRLCDAYASLSAPGVTILFSSGDGGKSGAQNQSVTSVGGTQNFNPETPASFPSGNFSNYFDTPSYQTTAKAAYLTELGPGSTYAGRFNTSGRGFLDVSAAVSNLQIMSSGYVMSVEGTSRPSPIFASVVSLLNDRLITAGKPVLGFLNPFLYSTGERAERYHDWQQPDAARMAFLQQWEGSCDRTGHAELGEAVSCCRAVI
ncbi:family S53 protease [Lactarius hatsudake]|nr:family S53 protease [Lactarius hatsudake]